MSLKDTAVKEILPLVFLVIALLLLLLSGLTGYVNTKRLIEDISWVSHTDEIKIELQNIHSSLNSVVADLRGFTLTGKDIFIASIKRDSIELAHHYTTLTELTKDNADLQQRLQQLKALLDIRFKLAKVRIRQRQQGLETVADAAKTVSEEQLNNQIRNLLQELVKVEDVLLTQRQTKANISVNNARLAFIFTGSLGLGLMTLVIVIIRLQLSELRRNELVLKKYEALVASSDDAIISKSLTGVIQSWNKGAEIIFGYTAKEAIGHNMNMLIPTDRLNEESEILARIAHGERIDHYETIRQHKDGRLIDISTTISPISNKDGKVIGASKIARDISLQKRSAKQIWHQANFDQLTDLPNRSLFFDRLSITISQARRLEKRVALLFIDLDGFKAVNDHFGHHVGDAVLKTVAIRCLAGVRETDTVARLGGDEFAIILSDLDTPDEAALIAQKLINALGATLTLPDGQDYNIGTSVGISIYPDIATEMDELLLAADMAMYQSKKRGKNTYTFSDLIPSNDMATVYPN
jgi:diguanylate cyclase (GGDEF)-like protein/PAS domain S-box-containing protein